MIHVYIIKYHLSDFFLIKLYFCLFFLRERGLFQLKFKILISIESGLNKSELYRK